MSLLSGPMAVLRRSSTPPSPSSSPSLIGTPRAIIDIGSNSIRIVVYAGSPRAPSVLFNEKVMAGLGASLASDGLISAAAAGLTLRTLERFQLLAREMGVGQLRTVATAALREAANGPDVLEQIRAIGLDVDLLSGAEEARTAGLGVIASIPDADGIVGDLGGGSLELVRVSEGRVGQPVSLPLGVLRLAAIRAGGKVPLIKTVSAALSETRWTMPSRPLPFYLVGGSWRALARLDMHLTGYALPIIHHYQMPSRRAAELVRIIARMDRADFAAVPALAGSRVSTLPDAAALLTALVDHFKSTALIVSAGGLREGLLYDTLDADQRALDPLIEAVREEGRRQGRFAEHGDLLFDWIAPLFKGETAEQARLRRAACLLGDVGWHANPAFRAERGMEAALHGNWVGVDGRGRAMIGQALFASFGGGTAPLDALLPLAPAEDLTLAVHWGMAMRLGQRLSGGTAPPLQHSTLARTSDRIILTLPSALEPLYGDVVLRRHRQLANLLGLQAKLEKAE